jgi:hypothetical protein
MAYTVKLRRERSYTTACQTSCATTDQEIEDMSKDKPQSSPRKVKVEGGKTPRSPRPSLPPKRK